MRLVMSLLFPTHFSELGLLYWVCMEYRPFYNTYSTRASINEHLYSARVDEERKFILFILFGVETM